MDLITLCDGIQLPAEIREKVLTWHNTEEFSRAVPVLEGLKSMETEGRARAELEEILEPDPGKIKMLTCMLQCGADLHRWYGERGIPDTVFFGTMGCFTRFIEECRVKTGTRAFDREWWTARQVSGRLFRIGELEYEMKQTEDGNQISIHIPSDAVLSREKCDASMEEAKAFFSGYFPEYREKDYVCHSWLLGPELKELLPPGSRILEFQDRFRILEVDYRDDGYVEWVFKRNDACIRDFPEDTLLQRNMKRYLLAGGKVGSGFGVVKIAEGKQV